MPMRTLPPWPPIVISHRHEPASGSSGPTTLYCSGLAGARWTILVTLRSLLSMVSWSHRMRCHRSPRAATTLASSLSLTRSTCEDCVSPCGLVFSVLVCLSSVRSTAYLACGSNMHGIEAVGKRVIKIRGVLCKNATELIIIQVQEVHFSGRAAGGPAAPFLARRSRTVWCPGLLRPELSGGVACLKRQVK